MNDMAKKRQQQLAEEGKDKTPGQASDEKETPPPPPPEPEERSPSLKEDLPPLGECGSCGNQLIWIKVNSRIRAGVCNNVRCVLYRERVKNFIVPPPKPVKPARRKKSKKGGAKRAGTDNRQGSKKGSK